MFSKRDKFRGIRLLRWSIVGSPSGKSIQRGCALIFSTKSAKIYQIASHFRCHALLALLYTRSDRSKEIRQRTKALPVEARLYIVKREQMSQFIIRMPFFRLCSTLISGYRLIHSIHIALLLRLTAPFKVGHWASDCAQLPTKFHSPSHIDSRFPAHTHNFIFICFLFIRV